MELYHHNIPYFWTVKARLQGLLNSLLSFIIVPVAWFYLLRDVDSFKAGALELFPPRRRDLVRQYALEVDEIVSNFMRGQLTVCLILGVIYSIGLQFVADIPLGILIGLLAGLVSIVAPPRQEHHPAIASPSGPAEHFRNLSPLAHTVNFSQTVIHIDKPL